MSKREHAKMNGVEDAASGSKHKRRREIGGSSSDMDITMADPAESKKELSKIEIKEMGVKIWTAVKDATKDGRLLAEPFIKKPPKKIYPDYYVLIKNPIALEDIKKRLDTGSYVSLEAVNADFELMFANAKQYNLPESGIYQDAKDLLKIAHKTFKKLSSTESDDKSKTPSLTKLLKSRLDKLTSKTDESGRYLSTEFMALPSKKIWPIYYQTIKNPECFDHIYKRLKDKEYQSAAQFAADVELIFSNAEAFNQEGTQIHNDTMTMKEYFKQLMSDLPQPHYLPQYSKATNKIKIRPPQQHSSQPDPTKGETKTSSTSITLRVPKAQPVAPTVVSKAAPPTTPAPMAKPVASTSTSTLPVAPVTAIRPTTKEPSKAGPSKSTPKASHLRAPATPAQVSKVKSATPQPAGQPVSTPHTLALSHSQAHMAYTSPLVAPVPMPITPAPTSILQSSSIVNAQKTTSHSPAPVSLPPNHQLKSASLTIQPVGRWLMLDHRDGVKSWSIRLVQGETSILVNQVTYMEEDENDGSDDEELDIEKDDEDDDDEMDVDHEDPSLKTSRKKKRGRGRPPKKANAAKIAKDLAKKALPTKLGEVQLKLNNFVVNRTADKHGEWNVVLPTGSNVIEIGEVNGMIWKIYAEKPADT